MKKSIYIISLLFGLLLVSGFVFANLDNIEYPVPELNNCQNEEECKSYCDNPDNINVCIAFAEANNLLNDEDLDTAKRLIKAGEVRGPGECFGHRACRTYCDNIDHIRECVDFAKKHDLIRGHALEEAEKVANAVDRGFKPPAGCHSKRECDTYCSEPDHMAECIAFAEAADLIPANELSQAKMVLKAIEAGVRPLPCHGREECDNYCQDPGHIDRCVEFATATGFMSAKEAIMLRKTGGKGPGNCRGQKECRTYCDNENHMEECIAFGEKHGLMSSKEAKMAKKMLALGVTAGPGNCKGRDECQNYCDNIDHLEECMDFAVKAGMMSEEEAKMSRKMMKSGISHGPGGCTGKGECLAYCDNSDNLQECMDFSIEHGFMTKEDTVRPDPEDYRGEDRREDRRDEYKEEYRERNERYRDDIPRPEDFPRDGRPDFDSAPRDFRPEFNDIPQSRIIGLNLRPASILEFSLNIISHLLR